MFSTEEVFADTTIQEKDSTQLSETTEANHTFQVTFIHQLIKLNADIQKYIKHEFGDLADNYSQSGSIWKLLLIFMFAFLYGILHSIGPGHGKVFIFSYILTEEPKIFRAIGISYMIALVHALSGLTVSLLIIYAIGNLDKVGFESSNLQNMTSLVSYIIIIMVGLYILLKPVFSGHHHKIESNQQDRLKLIPFIASIGFVPCPGTIIMVTFFASIGLLSIGVSSVLFIVLGMGFTISIIGIISIFSKQLITRLFNKKGSSSGLYHISSIIGGLLLVIFGMLFLFGTF